LWQVGLDQPATVSVSSVEHHLLHVRLLLCLIIIIIIVIHRSLRLSEVVSASILKVDLML